MRLRHELVRNAVPRISGLALAAGLLFLSACSLAGPPRGGRAPAPETDAPASERPGGESDSPSPERTPANPPPAATGRTYEVFGQRYTTLATAEGYRERGLASWYGDEFKGRPTANGEVFDPDGLTAAHRTLPLGTWVEVTHLGNGRSIRIRINDRGPFADTERRIIDLSYEVARRLGIVRTGVARVEVRALTDEEVREVLGGRGN